MRCATTIFTGLLLLLSHTSSWSQDREISKSPSLAFFTGIINYQGDLNPNSFTFGRSQLAAGIAFRQPLNRWFTARAGIKIGKIEAADRYNRDYLKPRNLSFYTSIKEAFAGLEINLLNISKTKFTPYLYGGVAVFHFNPWAYDNSGNKTYLQSLSTEGQGLPEFPTQKPYKLTQLALPFGGGLRFAVNDNINIAIEFSQRKTFTDYLDDVSSFYVDRETLLAAKGEKAVEMAYRGLIAPNASGSYPVSGEQRGTPSEMDWYYFTGFNIEVKLGAIASLFNGRRRSVANQRCPRSVW